jgi:hypothetical protein
MKVVSRRTSTSKQSKAIQKITISYLCVLYIPQDLGACLASINGRFLTKKEVKGQPRSQGFRPHTKALGTRLVKGKCIINN